MITENSVTYQFVANADNAAAVASGDAADLIEGAVAFANDAGTISPAGAIAAGTRVRAVQRINGELIFSPFFTVGQPTVTTQVGVAPVEQISFVGYNAVTGAGQLDVEDSREYLMSLHLYHTQGVFNNSPMIKSIPAWVAPQAAGTTAGQIQYLLSTALVTSLNRQFRRSPSQVVIGERVSDTARVITDSGAGSADVIDVVNGSTRVTFTEAGVGAGTLGAGHNFAAGTWIALNGAIYEIVAQDANSITLDLPYAGPSAAIPFVLGDTDILAAIGAADNFGVRLTGVTTPLRNPVTETPAQVTFKVTFDKVLNAADNGIQPAILTTIVEQVGATNGIGTGAQVAVKEVYATMNEGQPQVSSYPPTNYRRAANLGVLYNQKVINAVDQGYTSAATGQRPRSLYNIIIAVDVALVGTTWAIINAQIP